MKKVLRKVLMLLSIAALSTQLVSAQGGFSYQAVVRDAKGNFMADKNVDVRITLSYAGTDCYQEQHSLKTGQTGEISLLVGQGEVLAGKFDAVPWNTMKIAMKVQISDNGTDFVTVGETLLKPVPYSLFAGASETATTITAKADASDSDALFSVKNENGDLVFAVYPGLVKVFVNDVDSVAKARRSGFLVAGRSAKGNDDIFSVDADGTTVFVDAGSSKARRSGFLVAGRSAKDGADANLFVVDETGTQVYFDTDNKARRSGFLVAGRSAKDDEGLFLVNDNGTQVYFDADSSKARRSGFLVAGRSAKDGESQNVFSVNADGTTVFVNDADSSKARRSGFLVAGRSAKSGEDEDMFAVNNSGTQVYVDYDDKARRSGFLVAGRSAKSDSEIFSVNADGTQVYVDADSTDKARRSGFLVSGRTAKFDSVDYIAIDNSLTSFGINSRLGQSFNIVNMASAETLLSLGKNFNIETSVSALGTTIFENQGDNSDNGSFKGLKMKALFTPPVDPFKIPLTDTFFTNKEIDTIGFVRDDLKQKGDSASFVTTTGEKYGLTGLLPVGDYIGHFDISYNYRIEDTIINFRYNEEDKTLSFMRYNSNLTETSTIDLCNGKIQNIDIYFSLNGEKESVDCYLDIDRVDDIPNKLKDEKFSENYGDGVDSLSAEIKITTTDNGSQHIDYILHEGREFMTLEYGNYTWLWVKGNSTSDSLYRLSGDRVDTIFLVSIESENVLYLSERNTIDNILESASIDTDDGYEYVEKNGELVYCKDKVNLPINRFIEMDFGDSRTQYVLPANISLYKEPSFGSGINYNVNYDCLLEKGILSRLTVTNQIVAGNTTVSAESVTEVKIKDGLNMAAVDVIRNASGSAVKQKLSTIISNRKDLQYVVDILGIKITTDNMGW